MEPRAMTELLTGLVDWSREHGVTPWIAVWLAFGFLGLKFLGMVGVAVNRAAAGLWTHYSETLRVLEDQRDEARREVAALKAENTVLRDRQQMLLALRKTTSDFDED
jgi:hypothetical protein